MLNRALGRTLRVCTFCARRRGRGRRMRNGTLRSLRSCGSSLIVHRAASWRGRRLRRRCCLRCCLSHYESRRGGGRRVRRVEVAGERDRHRQKDFFVLVGLESATSGCAAGQLESGHIFTTGSIGHLCIITTKQRSYSYAEELCGQY